MPAVSKSPSEKEERGIGDRIADKTKELWGWWETRGTIKPDKKPTTQKPDGKSISIISEARNEKEKNK